MELGTVTTGEVEIDTSAVENKQSIRAYYRIFHRYKLPLDGVYNNVKPSLETITTILTSDHNPAWKTLKALCKILLIYQKGNCSIISPYSKVCSE